MWALVLFACAPPPPPAAELGPRLLAEPRLPVCPDAPGGPLEVPVRATDAAGLPLAGARIARQDVPGGAWTEVGFTGADGALTVRLAEAAKLTVSALPTEPGEACPVAVEEGIAPPGEPSAAAAPGVAPLPFRVALPVCTVTVEVVDPTGAAVPGASVAYTHPWGGQPFRVPEETAATTDAAGRAEALPVPCDLQLVSAIAPDGRVGVTDVPGVAGGETLRVVLPEPTAWLVGKVTSTAGGPVPGAEIWVTGRAILADADSPRAAFARLGTRVRADAAGQYRVALLPDPSLRGNEALRALAPAVEETFHVVALADGLGESSLSVGLAPGARAARDLALDAYPRVHLRCAGRPDDSCADLWQARCAAGFAVLEGDEEEEVLAEGAIQHAVLCPSGPERRVFLGPVSTEVAANENVAWLDFRGFGGGVRGKVAAATEAAPCFPTLSPTAAPPLLARDPGLGVAMETSPDGAFEALRIPPGRYAFSPGCTGAREDVREVEIDDHVVDLGVVGGA